MPPADMLPLLYLFLIAAEAYEEWDPNYCNDSALLKTAGLTKTAVGSFLGFECSSDFFQCRQTLHGGLITFKKKCRMGLIYDTAGSATCNYEFNVRGCSQNTKQVKKCGEDEFLCSFSDQCVPISQRCDEKYDCVLEEDEQNCPTCRSAQFPCVISEQCIPLEQRCDGNFDCEDKTDENNCKICSTGHFYCQKSRKCVPAKNRCDGRKDCLQGEDELFCHSDAPRFYTCWGQLAFVPLSTVCDGKDDCPDGSDEAYCTGKVQYDYVDWTETNIDHKESEIDKDAQEMQESKNKPKENNIRKNPSHAGDLRQDEPVSGEAVEFTYDEE